MMYELLRPTIEGLQFAGLLFGSVVGILVTFVLLIELRNVFVKWDDQE